MNNDEFLKFEGNEKEFKSYINNLEKEKIKFKGNLLNRKYEGRGILYDKYSGNIKYNGFFKNGKYDGFGLLYENENLKYQGFFNNGYYDGKGILYKRNKKIYDGYFKQNKYEGIGIEYFSNEKLKRKAIYSMNKIINECNGMEYYIIKMAKKFILDY